MLEPAFIALILIIFSAISYFKKSLDLKGILIANLVGTITYVLGSIELFFVMLLFFVAAEICTKYSSRKLNGRPGTRTISNIIGNSGPALITLVLGSHTAFFGALSAALSDTVSSEIGITSKRKPRLITTLKEVKAGEDGGVTILGFAASLAGALFMGILCFIITNQWKLIYIITIAGFMGSLIDSLLGALFERKKLMNNTHVNFLASSGGAIIAQLLSLL